MVTVLLGKEVYIFDPVCIILTLCESEKNPNKYKLLNQRLVFKVIKDLCCMIILPLKEDSSKK